MSPIRLAYLVDSMEVGGSELNAIRTLERLDRSRFTLSVVHMGASGPLTPRYEALGVSRSFISFRSFKHPSAFRAGASLARTLRRENVDILHCHDVYSNILGVPWGRIARVPAVIASKRWQSLTPIFSRPVPLLEGGNRLAMRWATRVLANGDMVARSLREADGIRPDRIQIIPNFLDEEAFQDYPEQLRLDRLAETGIPRGATVAGIVARLWPVKDQATMLHAAASLAADFPSLHVLLIGEGPSRDELRRLTGELGLISRVHFAGRLANRPNPHGLLDISVLPSLSEGFPNAVIEAMAAGKPVVASEVGGVPEAVVHGSTGFLVPPQDSAALAERLATLLRDPALARAQGERGRQRAKALYSAQPVLKGLMDWYASLLPARSGG